jgi:hypothetical protein
VSSIFVEAHYIQDVVVWIFNKETKDERRKGYLWLQWELGETGQPP